MNKLNYYEYLVYFFNSVYKGIVPTYVSMTQRRAVVSFN